MWIEERQRRAGGTIMGLFGMGYGGGLSSAERRWPWHVRTGTQEACYARPLNDCTNDNAMGSALVDLDARATQQATLSSARKLN